MTFAVAEQATLAMRGSGCTETATADGLAVEYQTVAASGTRLAAWHLSFGSLGSQGGTDQIRGRGWLNLANGYKVGLQMVRVDDFPVGTNDENYIYYWINRGSGWEVIFAIHGFNGNFVGFDDNVRVKVGVGIDSTSTRIDDVGGGPTLGWCTSAFKPQIFRRAYGNR